MKLIVYGSSDDLVEVEGDIREEFNGDEGFLVLSDGTVLKVEYNGVWRFERVQEGALSYTKHPDVPEDDGPRRMGGEFDTFSTYSEIVVLEGDVEVTSVTFGERWTAPTAPQRYKVVNRHGQKPSKPAAQANDFYYARENAQVQADSLNARGFEDGPFTVGLWGEDKPWYGEEGYEEARLERGEEAQA